MVENDKRLVELKTVSEQSLSDRLGRYNACVNLLATRAGMLMLNSRNHRDRTPVMLAAANGYSKVVKLLISRGALLVHNDLQGYTALHYAAVGGYTQTMHVLLGTKKTLVDMADKEQNTALHVSADKNQPKSIELLLTLKCALTLNEYGQSALDQALDGKRQSAVEAFFNHERWLEVFSFFGPEHDSPFKKVIQNMPEMAQALMDKSIETSNVNPNCPDYWVRFNFNFLVQRYCGDTFTEEEIEQIPEEPFAILEMMGEHGQEALLVHPLCSSYMEAKWKRYGQKMIVFVVILYSLFLGSISSVAIDKIRRVGVPNNILLKGTNNPKYQALMDSYLNDMSWWVLGCLYFSTCGAIFDLVSMFMLYLSIRVRFNFNFLVQRYCGDTFTEEEIEQIPEEPFAILEMMGEHGQEALLVHPLCSSYTEAKWKRYGQKMIVFVVILYSLFLGSISSVAIDKIRRVGVPNNILLKGTNNPKYQALMDSYLNDMSWWVLGCLYFSTCGAIFDLVSMFMLYLSIRKYQISEEKRGIQSSSNKGPVGVMGGVGCVAKTRLVLSACLTVYLGLTLLIPHGDYNVIASDFYILGVVSFLAWFQVLDVLQPFTSVGIYVVMYNEILVTTCKLILIFFALLIGFAVGFLVFFGGLEYTSVEELQNFSFASFPSALAKVFSMMLGEIDMTVTFIRNYEAGILTWCDLCFVVSFILLVCILFINLTIGLAVGDIAQLKTHSKVKGLQMTVSLFMQLEAHMKRWGLEKFTFIPMSHTVYLNDIICSGSKRKMLESLKGTDEAENMKLLKQIHYENEKNHCRIKSLNESMRKAEELLGLVVSHLEVQSPYDNQDEGHQLLCTGAGGNPAAMMQVMNTCEDGKDGEREGEDQGNVKVSFQNMDNGNT